MGNEWKFDDDNEDSYEHIPLDHHDDPELSLDFDSDALHGELTDASPGHAEDVEWNLTTIGSSARGKLSGLLGAARDQWSRPVSRDRVGEFASGSSPYVEGAASAAGHVVGVAANAGSAFAGSVAKQLFTPRRGEGIKDWAKRAGRNAVVTGVAAWVSLTAFVQGCLPHHEKQTPKADQPRETVNQPANNAQGWFQNLTK